MKFPQDKSEIGTKSREITSKKAHKTKNCPQTDVITLKKDRKMMWNHKTLKDDLKWQKEEEQKHQNDFKEYKIRGNRRWNNQETQKLL